VMANIPQSIRPTRNSAGPADREVVIDPQSPRGGGRRRARRLAVTSTDYDRQRARIKLAPGTGNAPANLGRLFVACTSGLYQDLASILALCPGHTDQETPQNTLKAERATLQLAPDSEL
jgi:hypothetical protein